MSEKIILSIITIAILLAGNGLKLRELELRVLEDNKGVVIMEDQTKLVEEIFEEEINQVDSWAPYYAHKLLNVSDPESWYRSNKIICEMFHLKHCENAVRIL